MIPHMEPTPTGLSRRRTSLPNMNSQPSKSGKCNTVGEHPQRAPGVEGSKNLEKMATDVERSLNLELKIKEDELTKSKTKKEPNSTGGWFKKVYKKLKRTL
ncbi:unnamed protein product [Ambrosiozyma monospora]|uniref:Unnamed protein product n=1 Tax=Ambrosiozyma monospora TaxID=43982 RepID=A0A9W7DGS5_AMBMO|nr:unnamed protein product [Ambrosiozyma monospora]